LTLILGYHDPKHYLDITSPAFRRKKLDKSMPPRGELLDMILEHPELLRSPVVLSGRLMTIGFNRQQLIEMFQLTVSNSKSSEEAGASSGGRGKDS
jgi:ArsC family